MILTERRGTDMKKVLTKLKKHWIAVWLIVAAVSLTAVTAYAVYTRVTVAKRVVSTQAGASGLFSSDAMSEGGMKHIEPFTSNESDVEVEVNVFNYDYPKSSVYRSEDTGYELTATIGKLDSSGAFHELTGSSSLSGMNYSVTYNKTNETFAFSDGNYSHTFSNCSISGVSAGKDTFALTFDKSEFAEPAKEYCIKLEAVPDDKELPTLVGYQMVRYSRAVSTGWSGKVEELDTNKNYDAFNYYLEGNGKGQITFRWDRTKVTINKDFLNNPNNKFVGFSTAPVESVLPDSNGIVSLTIEVDSTKQNRYEIQFFKVDPSTINYDKSSVETYLPETQSSDWQAAAQ